MRILFLFWHGLGDNILATPALRKYKKQYPDHFVGWAMLKRFQQACLFDDYSYIDQLCWISDAWNDFSSYEEGKEKVIQEGYRLARLNGYESVIPITHSQKGIHKILRTMQEMNIQLDENEVHTEYIYDEKKAQQFYSQAMIPKDYVFFHGKSGVADKNLSEQRVLNELRQLNIHLPLVSPDFWEDGRFPIYFWVDVMRKAKYIYVVDSVFYHMAHAFDLKVDFAYFKRGTKVWDVVHPLHYSEENIVFE